MKDGDQPNTSRTGTPILTRVPRVRALNIPQAGFSRELPSIAKGSTTTTESSCTGRTGPLSWWKPIPRTRGGGSSGGGRSKGFGLRVARVKISKSWALSCGGHQRGGGGHEKTMMVRLRFITAK